MARAYVVIISVLTFAIACGDNGGDDDGGSSQRLQIVAVVN